MNNKYLYMVVGGIITTIWFYTGLSAYYSGEAKGLSDVWWFGSLLAVGLGAGSTGGDDCVSIFVEGIKGYIPTMILLAIAALVGSSLFAVVTTQAAPDVAGTAHSIITVVVSAFLTNMTLSYFRKANA